MLPSQVLTLMLAILVLCELADHIHHHFCMKQRKSVKRMFETNQHHARYQDSKLFRLDLDSTFVFLVPYYWVITLILVLKWLLVNLLQTAAFNIKKSVIQRIVCQKEFNALVSQIDSKSIDRRLWLLFSQKYEVYLKQQAYSHSGQLYYMKKDIRKILYPSAKVTKKAAKKWNQLIKQSVKGIEADYGNIGAYLLRMHREEEINE